MVQGAQSRSCASENDERECAPTAVLSQWIWPLAHENTACAGNEIPCMCLHSAQTVPASIRGLPE
eukprot:2184119-Alexandrium_andersonii.AAC.1